MDIKQALAYIEDVNIDLQKLVNDVENFLESNEEGEEQVTQFLIKLKSNFEAQARLATLLIPADALKEDGVNEHTGSQVASEDKAWEDMTPQERLRQKLKDKVARYGGLPAFGAGFAMPKASSAQVNKLRATGTSAAVEIFTSKVGAEPEFVQKLAHRRQNEETTHQDPEMGKLRAGLKHVDKPMDFDKNESKPVTAGDISTDKDSALGNELASVLAKKRNQS
eukprot:TRINITY_DN2587_c0_g1_i1.p1 TRINITY_DN2587_c0_g1~~TRINITY_DN2587_c0_g1_i1.p1  ORF type:complete len:239 (+),score=33.58 TRINITY_DN2587_c0_g1_i1:49-717(+)